MLHLVHCWMCQLNTPYLGMEVPNLSKSSWVASIFYRKDIVEYEQTEPCRVDLKDDYDPDLGDAECCLLGVTINDYVGIRPDKKKKEEHMILSAYWDVYWTMDSGELEMLWTWSLVMNSLKRLWRMVLLRGKMMKWYQ